MPIKKRTKSKPKINIILLGDPGAGKATQGAFLSKKYDMFDFDMGRELTLLREKNSHASKILEKNYDKGILAPTKMCREIIHEKIFKLPATKNILFDGHPKMLGEAKIVKNLLKKSNRPDPLVLYIKIPSNEVIDRIQKRKGYYKTKYTKRADDTAAGLRNRAKYYRKNIAEVVEYFRSIYQFNYINGMGTRSEVRARVQQAVQSYLKDNEKVH